MADESPSKPGPTDRPPPGAAPWAFRPLNRLALAAFVAALLGVFFPAFLPPPPASAAPADVFATLTIARGVGLALAVVAGLAVYRHRRPMRGDWMARWATFISLPFFLGTLAFSSAERHHAAFGSEYACTTNLQRLHAALGAYLADDGGVLPDAARWTDELLPYLDPAALTCPEAPAERCSYAFNAALSGVPLASASDRSVIAIFESDAGWNASGGPELLPTGPRHGGRDSYLFVDGSIMIVGRHGLRASAWTPQTGRPGNAPGP